MSDAQAKPPEVRAAELWLDVAQPVVAGVAAALLEPRLPRLQVELVVDDEDLVGENREEVRECRDRAARFVHVGRRHADPQRASPRDDRREFRLVGKSRAEL